MVIKQGMLASNNLDVLGLDFLEDFPIRQYRTKHSGIATGIYILGMPSFRHNKINVPTSQHFFTACSKIKYLYLRSSTNSRSCHNSVLTAVSLRSSNLHYGPVTLCMKKWLQTTTALVAPLHCLVTLNLHGAVHCNTFTKKGTVVCSIATKSIFL